MTKGSQLEVRPIGLPVKAYLVEYHNPIPDYVDVDCMAWGALCSVLTHENRYVMPAFPFTMWHDTRGFVSFWCDDSEPWESV